MPEYGDHKYWNKRYQDQKVKTFDWLQDYNAVKFVIEKICTKESKILMLGCGNSLMSEEMYNDGYQNIYNIDISEIVIEQMTEMHKHLENMTYEVMDCTDLKYPDGFFDVVIDKSTIDAILCGENPDMMAAKTTKEVQRVLKPSGVYCAISYGFPEYRMCHFTMPHLSFDIEIIEMTKEEPNTKNKSTHHIYVCKKKDDADLAQAKWLEVEEGLLMGEDKTMTFIQKYSRQAENELEGLSVHSDDYAGANQRNDASDLSDDPEFLNRIMGGELTDAEVDVALENIKEDMNKVF